MDRDWYKETIQRYDPIVVNVKPFERWDRILLVHEWDRTGDIMVQSFGRDRDAATDESKFDTDDYSAICVSPDNIDDLINALREVKKRMAKQQPVIA